ncbi:DUF4190 domain-containing protein [Cryobacterium sp. MDT1-3]
MSSAPAGWYPNPNNQDEELLWDGAEWSGVSREAQAKAPVASTAPSVSNHLAAAAAIIGGISVVFNPGFLLSILAFIFGWVGVSRASRIGGYGRAPAWAGIVLGAVGLFMGYTVFREAMAGLLP